MAANRLTPNDWQLPLILDDARPLRNSPTRRSTARISNKVAAKRLSDPPPFLDNVLHGLPRLLRSAPPRTGETAHRRSFSLPEGTLRTPPPALPNPSNVIRRGSSIILDPSPWGDLETVLENTFSNNKPQRMVFNTRPVGSALISPFDWQDVPDIENFQILNKVSLMPWQICERLETILEAKPLYTEFLALRGPDAQSMINLLHQLLDTTDLQELSRSNLTKALIRLSKSASLYPSCLVLKETLRLGDQPEAGGGFGDVWKSTIFGQEVGVKVIRVYRKSDADVVLKSFYREAIVWSQFNHPNILPFYGIYFLDQEQRRLGLVSPWMQNGNITHYLAENSQVNRPRLILDVADGLAYLHRMSIVHGDLKPANILVTTSGRACLMDFGMSTVDDPRVLVLTSSSTHGGTTRYTAPELFDGSNNNQAADIYSFAYVCHEIFTGAHVFSGFNDAAIIYQVKNGQRPSRPDSSQLTNNMWDLMQLCWHVDPALRPKAEVIAERIRSTCNTNRPSLIDWDELFPKMLRRSLRGTQIMISEDELNEMLPKITS